MPPPPPPQEEDISILLTIQYVLLLICTCANYKVLPVQLLPCNSMANRFPSPAMYGKISFSIEVGRSSMRSSMSGENMYIPALILFDTNSGGFSTNRSICPVSGEYTTTPYLEGSSTFVTWKNRADKRSGKG